MVTLRLVDGKLSVLVEFGLQIFLDIWLGEKMLEISGEFTVLVHIRCEKGDGSALHFAIDQSVHELSLCLMRNVGPTYGMVGAAHRAEAETNHINSGAAESERTGPVELIGGTRCALACTVCTCTPWSAHGRGAHSP